MRRCSPALLVLRAIDALKVYLPFMLVQGSIAERLTPPFLWLWWALVAYYSVTRLNLIFFDWMTIRYSYSADGIVYRSGWLNRVTTQATWSQIGALHVEQNVFHQLLHRYQVRAVVGAEGKADITLDALDASTVAQLRKYHRATAGKVAPEPVPAGGAVPRCRTGPAPQTATSELYRARWPDYAIISVGYGQFVLLVPFLLGAWSEVADALALPNGRVLVDGLASGSWVMVASFIVAAGAFGFVRAIATYGGYRVEADADGFEAECGLWARHHRRARQDEVQGLLISQNPLMYMMGRYSVSLVLASARGEFRSLVVLPAAPTSAVRQLSERLIPGSLTQREEATTSAGLPWVVVAIGVSAAAVLAVLGSFWIATGGLLAALLFANSVWVKVWLPPAGSTVFRHRRGLLWRREYVMHTGAVRLIESMAMPGVLPRQVARVRVMDRRPKWLWLPLMVPTVADAFAAQSVRPRWERVSD